MLGLFTNTDNRSKDTEIDETPTQMQSPDKNTETERTDETTDPEQPEPDLVSELEDWDEEGDPIAQCLREATRFRVAYGTYENHEVTACLATDTDLDANTRYQMKVECTNPDGVGLGSRVFGDSLDRMYRNFDLLVERYDLTETDHSKFAGEHYRPTDEGDEHDWQPVRKKPVEVEARGPYYDPTVVETLEGDFEVDENYAEDGFYIIRGVEGEVYPCQKTIFEDTYDAIDPDESEGLDQ